MLCHDLQKHQQVFRVQRILDSPEDADCVPRLLCKIAPLPSGHLASLTSECGEAENENALLFNIFHRPEVIRKADQANEQGHT